MGPLLLGIFIDIYLMLAATLIVSLISYYLNAYYTGPFLNYSIKEQIKDILPSFGVAVIMSVFVYAMSFIQINRFILFPLQILVGIIITISFSEIIKLPEYLEIKEIIKPIYNKLFKR